MEKLIDSSILSTSSDLYQEIIYEVINPKTGKLILAKGSALIEGDVVKQSDGGFLTEA